MNLPSVTHYALSLHPWVGCSSGIQDQYEKCHGQLPLCLKITITRSGQVCCWMTPGLSRDIRCHVWPYFSKLANHQIRHQPIRSGLSVWWLHMVTLIFLRGLCGYVWVNVLTLPPLRVTRLGRVQCPNENIEWNLIRCAYYHSWWLLHLTSQALRFKFLSPAYVRDSILKLENHHLPDSRVKVHKQSQYSEKNLLN